MPNPDQRSLSFEYNPAFSWEPGRWPVAADWAPLVDGFLAGATGEKLGQFLARRVAQGAVIYPPTPFRALELTPLHNVKVVILGQDPYHGAGQAHGLAFSVPPGVKPPPSLRNIFKELGLGKAAISSGSLESWARQGVLLLNTCLTVEEGLPGSHAKQGWEALTDEIIKAICGLDQAVVFMLWGAHAQAKIPLMTPGGLHEASSAIPLHPVATSVPGVHLVLTANHPSPLSALRPPQPFLGCGHFQAANAHLTRHGVAPIHWFALA